MGDTAQGIWTQIQLQLRGIQTQATIIGLDTIVTYVRGRPSDHYAATYLFSLSDEAPTSPPYPGSAPITEDAYNRLREGDVITIRYLPDNPDTSSPISDTAHDYAADMGVSLIFVGIALAGLYAVVAMWRQDRRLNTQGRVIIGTIRSARGNQTNGKYQVTINYTFRPDEQEIEAYETKTRNDLKDATLPSKDAPIAVLYVDDKLYRLL